MRILQLVHQYPPEFVGGTERYTQFLSKALSGRGHRVDVFYRRSGPGAGLDRRDEGGVGVWAAWNNPITPPRRFLATLGDHTLQQSFAHVLEETRPELVHIEHLMGLPAQLFDQICDLEIPAVVTLHDYWWICANAQLITNYSQELCGGPRLWLNCAHCALARAGASRGGPLAPGLVPLLALRERRLRRILDSAACLIAPSGFVKEWYIAHGVPQERIRVLAHGVERPLRPLTARPPGATLRIAYIGGLSAQKGVHVLIEAAKQLTGACELWIAGDERADPEYVAKLRSAAGQQVSFLGALDRAQLWECLAQVDALAVPSLWYETFSLITHEAFAAGVPVLASNLGALASAVRNGVNGLLIAPGNVEAWSAALQQLVDDPLYPTRLREGIVPAMTTEEHADRMEQIYRAMICARPISNGME